MIENSQILELFYTTPRMGVVRLSDQGGPFGFDIHMALEVCWLIDNIKCDAIVETGCHMGDTSDFLSRAFPETPFFSCDIEHKYANFSKVRVNGRDNCSITTEDSLNLVKRINKKYKRPFYFLDSHWNNEWPLAKEVDKIDHGIVCIHDFNINHPRFDYDVYGEVECGYKLLSGYLDSNVKVFVNNADANYPFPCLQPGRRSGRAYYVLGKGNKKIKKCPYLRIYK